jgi:hypothetical protein
MRNVTAAQRRRVWAVSAVIGMGLVLRTSDLSLEIVSLPRVASPMQPSSDRAAKGTDPVARSDSGTSADPEIKVLARDISRRFHVARSAALSITEAAFAAAADHGIDPTLVLAVAAVESKFKPRAVNPASGATGLMQVVPKWHQDKVLDAGGEPSLLLIAPNINVGAAILAEYVDADAGNVTSALGRYLGSAGANRYVKQVLREMDHLVTVLRTL